MITDRVEVPTVISDLTETVTSKTKDYAAAGKEQAGKVVEKVSDTFSDIK